ncbi:hypothetical protein HELRODRAFT_194424 [Helobdella robusta]|uniref:Tetraspanin n=1 Tax=Helobdella robusta TaxID=6412 RepID=T1FW16_HELRO|nr:hypothetical protein HELRODRAFT_194424 [Helobdella robusta]ESN92044.1 hypothetical protein HELRODRAFT_194424 [Helobdella robusta]
MSLGSHKKRRHNSGEVCPMMDIESIDDRLFSTSNVFCLKVLYSFYNVLLLISKDLLRYLQHFMHIRNNQGINSAFDFVQKKFKCCGITSYLDWFELDESNNRTEMFVPDSCCISDTLNCGLRIHPSNIHYDGCAKPLDKTIQQQLTAICLGSFGLCCVELFGIILSCCLMKKIKDSKMLPSVRY